MISVTALFGAGSGIDTQRLIADLAAATRQGRVAQIATQTSRNDARISALGTVMATIAAFADQYAADGRDPAVTTAKLAENFVAGFNELRTTVSQATGTGTGGLLTADGGVRATAAALSRVSTTALAGAATATLLGDIGIRTNKDGTLAIDRIRLTAAIAADPDGIRAMLTSASGLTGVLDGLRTGFGQSTGPLGQSVARYERIGRNLTRQQERADAANTVLVERLTKSFSAMDRQVAAIKASQAYLKQQIDAWNSTGN